MRKLKLRELVALVVVVAQLGVLAYMAGEREWVLRSGRSVLLRTAPIDPRDPMRGDYVRLGYDIASVPKRLCRDGVLAWFEPNVIYKKARDRRVYAAVKLDDDGVAQLISVSDKLPASGLFLRGRTDFVSQNSLQVRFGVEALFMQQGKAREFENLVRGERSGVPLNVEVAVGRDGLAVIRGYQWEPLGITLTLEREPAAVPASNQPQTRRQMLLGVTVHLKNQGDKPVAIVAGDDARFFRIIPRQGDIIPEDSSGWVWTRADEPKPTARADEVRILQPGESYDTHLDLMKPEWYVRKIIEKAAPGPAVSIPTLTDDWMASFRIEYAPPSRAECVGLPDAALIRHAPLRSRAFGPAGGGD